MVYLVFKGLRLDYLTSQKPAYDNAVANGTTNDFVDAVYGRYARRYPIELELDDEPSPEFLAAVDDKAPDPKRELLYDDPLDEEQVGEDKKITTHRKLIQKCKKVCVAVFDLTDGDIDG